MISGWFSDIATNKTIVSHNIFSFDNQTDLNDNHSNNKKKSRFNKQS